MRPDTEKMTNQSKASEPPAEHGKNPVVLMFRGNFSFLIAEIVKQVRYLLAASQSVRNKSQSNREIIQMNSWNLEDSFVRHWML